MVWGPKLAAGAVTVACLAAASACAAPATSTPASIAQAATAPAVSTPASAARDVAKHDITKQAASQASATGSASAKAPAARSAAARAAAATASPVPVIPAKDPQKGVGAWTFDGVSQALAQSGASWYYTWTPDHSGITTPSGTQFVPMIWGAANVTAATLSQVQSEGNDLLTFNEPDMSSQADMSPAQALSLWPQLEATGMQLGSPAVSGGAATSGGWLSQFMQGAQSDGYRVNFIALHWYGGDFVTSDAVTQLKTYLQATYAMYHLPIWLTEFALVNFGATWTYPSAQVQAAFLTAATQMLRGLSYVQRYAWFGLPATSGDGTAGLFNPGGAATPAGSAFEAVP